MSRRGAVASIVSFALSFASVGHAEAQDPSAHCSLMWPVVQREFSPERGWQLRGEAFSFSRTGEGPPEFQVLFFESVIDSGTAVIIAEWGAPDSPELGPLVYCAVHDCEGRLVDEIGQHPFTTRIELCPEDEACA